MCNPTASWEIIRIIAIENGYLGKNKVFTLVYSKYLYSVVFKERTNEGG